MSKVWVIPEDPKDRVLFFLAQAAEALERTKKATHENRFAVARMDAHYGSEFLELAERELADLTKKG